MTSGQGDLKLSGHGVGGGTRTRERRAPADLRADTLSTVPQNQLAHSAPLGFSTSWLAEQWQHNLPCNMQRLSVKACPTGTFGWRCKLSCANCAEKACDPVKAQCLQGCLPGFYGPHCLFESDYMYNAKGIKYLGDKNVTKSGKSCVHWSKVNRKFQFEEGDDPQNFCRNPIVPTGGYKNNPWCYTSENEDLEDCEIKYRDDGCPRQLFGDGCLKECHCKNDTKCDRNGVCNCAAGWEGDTCQQPCEHGKYGFACKESCPNCLNEDCDPETGICRQGCLAGFTGPMCTKVCVFTYGENCAMPCGKCLNGTMCDRFNGHCKLGCQPGFTSSNTGVSLCDEECEGRYGKNCKTKCGACRNKAQCDKITGECPNGCQNGFATKFCNKICDSHYYGKDCAQQCGKCKDNQSCDPFTGGCRSGCVEGHSGFMCFQRMAEDNDSASVALYGGIGAAIAIVLLLLLFCLVYKKRRHKNLSVSKTNRDVAYVDDHMNRGESCLLLEDSRVGSEPPSHVREEDENAKNQEPIYVNVTNRKQSMPVPVPDLYDYICKNKERSCEGFIREFEELPMGLLAQCDIARKPENKSKNRYGNIVAYDHSRVILDPLPNEPFSDYVNANFMDGYSRKQMYIASQGPNKVMIRDFWRMVWQHRVSKIVMLTNLHEVGKKKCEQYWPDEGTQKYGDLSVLLVNATKYSDFVIRTFELTKEGENSRIVKQFHFTTWSDHGAPTYPTTLLAFRRKVVNFKPEDTAPILSHC
ncbi:receptor-type tyrosine-protein phosphatase kappa, partial [Plakobranchus ocellatus]